MRFNLRQAINSLLKSGAKPDKKSGEKNFFDWLDEILSKTLPDAVEAINFNLYQDYNNTWSVELVGTSEFDENDHDWACNEVYSTEDNPYVLVKESDWKTINALFTSLLEEYLVSGKYSDVLKKYKCVGLGFVDGDISIIYKK